jgi:hypothetical protein
MYTSSVWSLRGTLSAALAAAIVAVGGLTLDRGHAGSLRTGIIEIGELTPADALPRVAQLPEIVVIAKRAHESNRRAEA